MQQTQITSIIDNCDLHTAFSRLIYNKDPNKAKNRKTKILDNSSFYVWNESDYKLFDVTKGRNLDGTILDHKYDIIIYESPSNKSFHSDAIVASKIYNKIINIGGSVIVKVKDFKLNINNNLELKGSYDIKLIFESNNFYLNDQFIYKNKTYYNQIKNDIDHLYFMIFKKKAPLEKGLTHAI